MGEINCPINDQRELLIRKHSRFVHGLFYELRSLSTGQREIYTLHFKLVPAVRPLGKGLSSVKHIPNLLKQGLYRKWFLQEVDASIKNTAVGDYIGSVP